MLCFVLFCFLFLCSCLPGLLAGWGLLMCLVCWHCRGFLLVVVLCLFCFLFCFLCLFCFLFCFLLFLCQGYWLGGGYSWAVPGLLALVGVFHLLSCGWGYWLSWLWLMLGLLAWLVGGVFPALLFLSQCAVVPFS